MRGLTQQQINFKYVYVCSNNLKYNNLKIDRILIVFSSISSIKTKRQFFAFDSGINLGMKIQFKER